MEFWTHHSGARVVVDRRGQVLLAELKERAFERPPASLRGEASNGGIALLDFDASWSAPVHRSVADAGVDRSFTPLFALRAKAKHFDDRVYAALDQLAHVGAGEIDGLFSFAERLRTRLPPESSIRGLFDAARHLAGHPLPEDGPARHRARKWLVPFLTDPKLSHPIGFYAESDALQRIFRHDRIFQGMLEQDHASPIRTVLDGDSRLQHEYRRYLAFVSKLTGPPAHPSIEDTDARECAFLPASDAAENRLVKELFESQPVPNGFELGAELVTRIRDGRLRSEPSPRDGWYAYQFHALAALLEPETEGLHIGPRYRRDLEETFKALFAMTRETHVKQLESVAGGGSPIIVSPACSVEPIPEHYSRVATSYAFLRRALTEVLGEHTLRCSLFDDAMSIWDALVDMEALFVGAAASSRMELGQIVEPTTTTDLACARFRAWQRESATDEALATDLRVAVPVWFDIAKKTVRICVTLGVTTRHLELSYVTRPKATVFAGESHAQGAPMFWSTTRLVLSPLTMECDVRAPPSREQLRRICDEHVEPARIRAALEATC